MDILLDLADDYVFDKAYAYLLPHPPIPQSLKMNTTTYPSYTSMTYQPSTSSLLPRDSMLRQCISLYTIALVGALILYYSICSFSYFLFFDKRLEHHPRFLKNQKSMEIKSSMIAAPVIGLLTLPWFMAEIHGKSMLYDNVEEYGWGYLALSVGLYMFFNDFFIYWIHRLEHHPRIYKYIHKPHHKWVSKSILCWTSIICWLSSSYTLGSTGFPPIRRICSIPTLPVCPFITCYMIHPDDQRVRVHLPNAQTTLPLPLCHGPDLDNLYPRRRHDFRFMVGEVHQFASTSYPTPPLFHLQLRSILHMGRFVLRLVPFAWRRPRSSTCCYRCHAEERIGGRTWECYQAEQEGPIVVWGSDIPGFMSMSMGGETRVACMGTLYW